MSIVGSEIIWRKSQNFTDGATNGGRMTPVSIPTGVKNSVFGDVPASERLAGSIKYRKVFIHIANDDDLALIQPRVFVETFTPGDDSVTIFLGSQTDTESGVTGSERLFGGGQLNSNVSNGATTIKVDTEGASLDYFKPGDLVRISDKTSVTDTSGNEDYRTIDSVTYAGDVATITLTDGVGSGYTASGTRVASVLEVADVEAGVSNFTTTAAGSGTYDDSTYPVLPDHIGAVQDTWTLTFTSSTQFECVGAVVGTVGTGNVSSDFQPSNPEFSKPYFVLSSSGFGGSFQSGDTISFETTPAAIPVWYRRDVPAGASSLSGNRVVIGVDGESQ